MRTEDEVIDILRGLYNEEFGGKVRQRFRLSWADLRVIYGTTKLFRSRFESLKERAFERGLYVWNPIEDDIVVVRRSNVERWRRVPKRIIEEYREVEPQEPAEEEDE